MKLEIVEAALAPGASVSVIARQYDVNANQVFGWRKRYREGLLGPIDAAPLTMVPVTVTTEPIATVAPSTADTIEIELAGKYRIRVGSGVDGKALRRVLDALERR